MKMLRMKFNVIYVLPRTIHQIKIPLHKYVYVIFVIKYSINKYNPTKPHNSLKLVNANSVWWCISDFMYIKMFVVIYIIAPVAQLVAHQTSNLRVAGSIPVWCDFFCIYKYKYYKQLEKIYIFTKNKV
jgi:hypothetical protein